MPKILYLALIWLLFPFIVFCQSQIGSSIKVISFVKKEKVLIRWAPNEPLAWKYANEYGYKILRYTIVRDKKVLTKAEVKVINDVPIKPAPLNNWESDVKKDNYVAIAAQSIYGKYLEVDTKNSNLATIINKSKEIENRFGFCLYSADRSLVAAKLSGLYFEDTDIKQNEKYLYKVYTIVPHNIIKVDTGFTYVDADKITTYPILRDVKAEFGDKRVAINWNADLFKAFYSGYFIEKSGDNGKNWQRINKDPYVIINNRNSDGRLYFQDSLAYNEKEYGYRIIGAGYFGEEGPPSKILRGKGKNSLPESPRITQVLEVEKTKVKIEWSFPESYNKDI
mgnify:CR=1 FL=1